MTKPLNANVIVVECLDDYLPIIEVLSNLREVDLDIDETTSLELSSCWQVFTKLTELTGKIAKRLPIKESLLRVVALPEAGLSTQQLAEVYDVVRAAPWSADLESLTSSMRRYNEAFADALSHLPRVSGRAPYSISERVDLIAWMASYLRGDGEELKLLSEIVKKDFDQPTQLIGEVRNKKVRREGAKNGVKVTTDFDNLPGEAKQVFVLGYEDQSLENLVVQTRAPIYLLSSAHASEHSPESEMELFAGLEPYAQTVSPVKQLQVPTPEKISVTALGQFATCPYRYLAGYVFKLGSEDVADYWQLSRRRLGDAVHHILEHHLQDYLAGKSIDNVDMDKALQTVFGEEPASVLQQVEWLRMREVIRSFLKDEAKLLQDGQVVHAIEWPFAIEVSVRDGDQTSTLSISGRIDRLDVIDEKLAVVIDYKTSSGAVSPLERQQMASLVSPQLAIYLLAIRQLTELKPSVAMEARLRSGHRGGIAAKEMEKRFKSASYLKLDEDDFLPAFRMQLEDMATSLVKGEFAPNPAKANRCGLGQCPHWGICRFDLTGQSDDNVNA